MTTLDWSAMSLVVVHPSADRYGADRGLVELLGELRSRGAEVTVATSDDGPLSQELRSLGITHTVDPGLPVMRREVLSPIGLLTYLRQLRRFKRTGLRVDRCDPNAVLCSTIAVLPAVRALRLHLPTVCHVHQVTTGWPNLVEQGYVGLARGFTGILANSNDTAGRLRQMHLLRNVPVTVATPGSRILLAPTSRTTSRGMRLLCIGRLSRIKNQLHALRVLQQLRAEGHEATLTFVGDSFRGNERYAHELTAYVTAYGLGDAVYFRGYLDDITDVLDAHDLLIAPSITESWGLVAIEAAARGLPVLASGVGGFKESVLDGLTGRLLPLGDPGQWAHAIVALLTDTQLYADLSTNSLRHATLHQRDVAARRAADALGTLLTRGDCKLL